MVVGALCRPEPWASHCPPPCSGACERGTGEQPRQGHRSTSRVVWEGAGGAGPARTRQQRLQRQLLAKACVGPAYTHCSTSPASCLSSSSLHFSLRNTSGGVGEWVGGVGWVGLGGWVGGWTGGLPAGPALIATELPAVPQKHSTLHRWQQPASAYRAAQAAATHSLTGRVDPVPPASQVASQSVS